MNQQDQNWMVKPKPPIQGCSAYLEQKTRVDAYLATYDADAAETRRIEMLKSKNIRRKSTCSSDLEEMNGGSK